MLPKGFTGEQRADSTAFTYQNTDKNNGQATGPNILPRAAKVAGSTAKTERKRELPFILLLARHLPIVCLRQLASNFFGNSVFSFLGHSVRNTIEAEKLSEKTLGL